MLSIRGLSAGVEGKAILKRIDRQGVGRISKAERADLIVANPPYVPNRDAGHMSPEVVSHEPHVALFGGPEGLEIARRLLTPTPSFIFLMRMYCRASHHCVSSRERGLTLRLRALST